MDSIVKIRKYCQMLQSYSLMCFVPCEVTKALAEVECAVNNSLNVTRVQLNSVTALQADLSWVVCKNSTL